MKTDGQIVLTGRVYVHGVLEDAFMHLRVSRKPNRGDLRVHSHLDEAGCKNRARGFTSSGYSGELRATIFDGRSWRIFMLAKEVDVEVRHFNKAAQRNVRAAQVIRSLSALKGFSCVWKNGGFVVDHTIPPVPSSVAPVATSSHQSQTKPATKPTAKASARRATSASNSKSSIQPSATKAAKRKSHSKSSCRRPKKYRSARGQRHLF